jgi:hypothetical protein
MVTCYPRLDERIIAIALTDRLIGNDEAREPNLRFSGGYEGSRIDNLRASSCFGNQYGHKLSDVFLQFLM